MNPVASAKPRMDSGQPAKLSVVEARPDFRSQQTRMQANSNRRSHSCERDDHFERHERKS